MNQDLVPRPRWSRRRSRQPHSIGSGLFSLSPSLGDEGANEVLGGLLAATLKKNDSRPANFQLNTRVDPFKDSVLRVNVN